MLIINISIIKFTLKCEIVKILLLFGNSEPISLTRK